MADMLPQSTAVNELMGVLRQPLDSVTLRVEVLAALRRVIDFDGYVWVMTDPVSTVGAAPVAFVPGVPLEELPAVIRNKYLTRTNRWTGLMRGSSPVGLLGTSAESDMSVKTPWREQLAEYGVCDVASTVFADAFGCWGFLDLWRLDRSRQFTDHHVQVLAALAPHMTTSLRECQARTFADAATPQREGVTPVVFTLDEELRIIGRTAGSQRWLDVLLPPGPGANAVPASVYNVAAQLLAREAGVDDHPASTRTHLSEGFWLTLRAGRHQQVEAHSESHELSGSVIVVTVEESAPVERLDVFCRAFGLSAREGQLLGLLAGGADTRAMARRMAVTEFTIQDHLKSIFSKTGAHDRIEVLSRAVGTRNFYGLPVS